MLSKLMRPSRPSTASTRISGWPAVRHRLDEVARCLVRTSAICLSRSVRRRWSSSSSDSWSVCSTHAPQRGRSARRGARRSWRRGRLGGVELGPGRFDHLRGASAASGAVSMLPPGLGMPGPTPARSSVAKRSSTIQRARRALEHRQPLDELGLATPVRVLALHAEDGRRHVGLDDRCLVAADARAPCRPASR